MQNIDAIGAWPPKRDSHVEMDGAWALYEAWVRLQLGDIDVAVAMGSGRSSTADPALIYPMEMDPYYLAPLGADARQLRRAAGPRAASTRARSPSARWPRSRPACRRDAKGNPHAQVSGDFDVDELLAERLRARAAAPARPPADHRRRVRGRDRPRRQGPGAVRQPGLDHAASPTAPSCTTRACATCTTSPSTTLAAKAAGRRRGAGRGGRAPGRVHPRGAAARRGARPRAPTWPINPSGGPLAANPIMATGLVRIAEAAQRRSATAASTARSRTRRRVRACSRTWSASWRGTTE